LKLPIFRLFTGTEFGKNVMILFTGASLSQLIPLLAEPVLTRLFAPEDFGILALYISVTALFSIIASGRYELAVMLPGKDQQAVNLVGLSFFITLGMTIFSLIIVHVFNEAICTLLNSEALSPYLYLVPATVLCLGIWQTLNYWTSRNKRFAFVAASRVTQSLGNAGAAILFGIRKMAATGLVTAYIIGQFLSIIPLVSSFFKHDRDKLKQINRRDMIKMGREYVDFPKINSIHAFSDSLQLSGVAFLISYFFNQAVLGFYSRTFRIMMVPAGFIGSSIAQVFYQKASETWAKGDNIKPLVKKTMLNISVISLCIFSVIFFFGPPIFGFVLGEKWTVAGEYAQILSPWIFLKFIISPVSQVPMIVSRQKQMFLYSTIANIFIIFSIFYGGYFVNDIKYGFYLLTVTQSIYCIFMIFWLIKISGIRNKE